MARRADLAIPAVAVAGAFAVPYLHSLGTGSPAQAADICVTDFERAGIPAYGTREEAAAAVAQACGI